MPDFEPIPYRIRIGVTGHRKLDDHALVLATVKRAIDAEVENLFPEESRQNIVRVRSQGTTAISYRVSESARRRRGPRGRSSHSRLSQCTSRCRASLDG